MLDPVGIFKVYGSKNEHVFASEEKLNYWKEVDLYIGGTEHAVGHLMYSRFWHKFLFDLGYVHTQEPFKKLVNQGMIQGEINRLFLRKNKQSLIQQNMQMQIMLKILI